MKCITIIKEFNLSEEKLKEIMTKTKLSKKEVEEIDDFHIEYSKKSMVKWIYEDMEEKLIDRLLNGDTLEMILSESLVFDIGDDEYLFLYE